MRILITGGEKCPEKTYRQYQELCPGGYFLEGYGITECSPVVALNRPGNHKDGAMGPAIPCLETKILLEDGSPAPLNTPGLLYVRGDSVFGGYLNYDGPSPFVKFDDGPVWYCTGDIVKQDEDGFLSFAGRKKRFCKVGGEMISLPAIEQVLMDHYRTDDVPIPLAVEAIGPDQAPEITLFSVVETDRETVNGLIRNAGYSPIHFIRNIIRLPEIPLLGSGKTDYRSLKELARNPQG